MNARNAVALFLGVLCCSLPNVLTSGTTVLAFLQADTTLFEQAQAAMGEENFARAIELLEQAVRDNPKSGDGWNALAEAYMGRNTVRDRLKAEKALKQALKVDYKNVHYNMTLGKLLLLQGLPVSAKHQFKKTIQLNPDATDAFFEIGKYHAGEMARGMRMSAFRVMAAGDYRKALIAFDNVLSLNPNDVRTYIELGKLAYYRQNYVAMERNLRQAVKLAPEDHTILQLIGLALVRQNKPTLAWGIFDMAKKLMDTEERRAFDSIEYFANQQFLSSDGYGLSENYTTNMTKDGAGKRNESYWTSQDPLFMTPYNERQLEHYARFAEANLLFTTEPNKYSSGNKSIPGWKTEQGLVYIKFGPPNNWIIRKDEIYDLKEIIETMPYSQAVDGPRNVQQWRYKGFSINFGENIDTGYGHPVLGGDVDPWGRDLDVFDPNEKHRSRKSIEVTLQETPEIFEPEYVPRKFELPVAMVQFRGEKEKTDILVRTGLPIQNLRFVTQDNGYAAFVYRGIFLFNNAWKKLDSDIEKLTVRCGPAFQVSPDKVFPTYSTLHVPPGDYHLAVEVEEQFDRKTGVYRLPVTVRDFSKKELQTSDILLADNITHLAGTVPRSRSDFQFTPNINAEFPVFHPVYLYYEVYNLSLDPLTQHTRFRVDCTLELQERHLAGLWRFDQSGTGIISTTAEYEGDSDTDLQYLRINVGNAQPGVYRVHLQVTDVLRSVSTVRETRVTLKPLEPKENGPLTFDPGILKDGLQSLDIEPENALTHYHLGVMYYNGGKLGEAIREFQSAMEYAPDQAAPQYGLALALRDQGLIRPAMEHALAAHTLDAQEPLYQVLTGTLAGALGQFEQAAKLLDPSEQVKDPFRHLAYARLCDFPGGWRVATEYYDLASMDGMDFPDAQHNLGRSLLHMDQADNAGVWFKLAGAIDPHYMAQYILRRTDVADSTWLRAQTHRIPLFLETVVTGGDARSTALTIPFTFRFPPDSAAASGHALKARLWLFDSRWTKENEWHWERTVELPVAREAEQDVWCYGDFPITCHPGRYVLILLVQDENNNIYSHTVREALIPKFGDDGLTLLPPAIHAGNQPDHRAWFSATDTLHVSLPSPMHTPPAGSTIRWTIRKFFKQQRQPKLAQWLGMDDHITKFTEITAVQPASDGICSHVTVPLNLYQAGAYMVQVEILSGEGTVMDASARRFTVGTPGKGTAIAPEILSLGQP